jgi:hypothetical protein
MIYRYNLDKEVVEELEYFATINRNTDRSVYKERWNDWLKEKEDLVRVETERLVNLGYGGDVRKKMYKSVRYYVSTKRETEPKSRRKYVAKNDSLLQIMDAFILEDMQKEGFTPRQSFLDFCQNNGEADKKMFKNRYYKLRPANAFQKSIAF